MNRRGIIIGILILILIGAGAIWLSIRNKNKKEAAQPLLSVTAFDQTKNADATSGSVNPNDLVIFTLSAENRTDKVISGYTMEVNIADLTSASTLIDAQGASYNSANNSLVWSPQDIPQNGSIQKQFTVRVNPFTQGANPTLKVVFNNTLEIPVANPSVAGVNSNTSNPANNSGNSSSNSALRSPTTGNNLSFVLLFASIVTFAFVIKRYFLF